MHRPSIGNDVVYAEDMSVTVSETEDKTNDIDDV